MTAQLFNVDALEPGKPGAKTRRVTRYNVVAKTATNAEDVIARWYRRTGRTVDALRAYAPHGEFRLEATRRVPVGELESIFPGRLGGGA